MSKKNWSNAPDAPVVLDPSVALLTYRQVREMFGWETNYPIRQAVIAGELVRVRISKRRSGWRITAESALKRRKEKVEIAEAGEFFGYTPEQLRQLRMAKQREDAAQIAVAEPSADEIRAEEQKQEAIRQMNEYNERAAHEHMPPNTNLDYWLKKVGYVPPVIHGTPEEINAAFIASENAKPPIWVGDQAFHGVDEHGLTAEARATIYVEELKRRKRIPTFSQQRGI